MNIEKTFALITERAQISERYIMDKITKEEYYAEMDRIEKEMKDNG